MFKPTLGGQIYPTWHNSIISFQRKNSYAICLPRLININNKTMNNKICLNQMHLHKSLKHIVSTEGRTSTSGEEIRAQVVA